MSLSYYVKNENTEDYWSSELGWTEYVELADLFTEADKQANSLPTDGYWATK